MGTSILKTGFYMVAVFYCAISVGVNAQEISKTDLEQRAISNFEKQRYDKAASDFEVLSNMFPKDARYAYFLGRSYLHSNLNITRAAELIKYAATRNYGEDAYFYLGRAYLLNYQFIDANNAFTTFRNTATIKQIEKYEVDYWIEVCNNSLKSVTVAEAIHVENLQIIPVNTIESAFRENLNGKYIYVPDEFRSQVDIETDYQSLIFIPQSFQNGDYLYYSSRKKKDKTGLDIYRVQRITAENYSLPEVLPSTVNSPYDEAYPYFDKANNILYFSSKNINTSGGYDIFRSRYDALNLVWSTPEKLNFPINTPSDDFLYTPTQDGKGAIFLSNRNSGLKEFEAYTINTSKLIEFTSPNSRDEVLTCALLSPAAISINMVKPEKNNEALSPAVKTENQANYTAYSPEVEYARLVQEALDFQSKSDSLNWSSKEIQLKSENESDYLRKQELLANLTTIQQESKRMQRLADEKFLQADQIRGAGKSDSETALKTNKEKEINNAEMTQYTFSNKSEKEPTSNSAEQYKKGVNAAKNASNEISTVFAISNKPVYSNENPIPVAMLPSGLVYRIQLGSFTNAIPDNSFGGLSPVSKEKSPNDTKYFVGYFSSITHAREALEQVKKYGYPDAFIVSYLDSKRIPIQKAREIEFAEKQ